MDKKTAVPECLKDQLTHLARELHGEGIVYMGPSDAVDSKGKTLFEVVRNVGKSECRTLLITAVVNGTTQHHVFALGAVILPHIPRDEAEYVPHSLLRLASSPYYPTVIGLALDRIANVNKVKEYLVNIRKLQFLN